MNIREEIKGKRLDEFKAFNTGQYETESQLGNRYDLTSHELYEFYQKTGKLYLDGTLKEYLFKTKDNKYPFGPVVAANNTLYYLSTYWDRAFNDQANLEILKDIQKTKKSLQQCLKIDSSEKTSKKVIKNKYYWTNEYISTYFSVVDGSLYDRYGKLIDNKSGATRHNKYKYMITDLIRSLEAGIDYPGDTSGKAKSKPKAITPIEKIDQNVQKKITEMIANVKSIPNPKYECYVFLAITKEGERLAQYSIKNVSERIALQSFMPTV